jgi:hypothetical protein
VADGDPDLSLLSFACSPVHGAHPHPLDVMNRATTLNGEVAPRPVRTRDGNGDEE